MTQAQTRSKTGVAPSVIQSSAQAFYYLILMDEIIGSAVERKVSE